MKVLNKDYIEQMTGYRPFTTFWEDLSIAERFGIRAINSTYRQVYNSWREDYKYWTEFVMTLSWKASYYYKTNTALSKLYSNLYYKASDYARDNFKGEELEYYYRVTD